MDRVFIFYEAVTFMEPSRPGFELAPARDPAPLDLSRRRAFRVPGTTRRSRTPPVADRVTPMGRQSVRSEIGPMNSATAAAHSAACEKGRPWRVCANT